MLKVLGHQSRSPGRADSKQPRQSRPTWPPPRKDYSALGSFPQRLPRVYVGTGHSERPRRCRTYEKLYNVSVPPTQGLASRPFLTVLLYTSLLFYILYSILFCSTLPFRVGHALLPEQEQKQEQEQEQEQEPDQEQDQEQDVLLWNWNCFSTDLFVKATRRGRLSRSEVDPAAPSL